MKETMNNNTEENLLTLSNKNFYLNYMTFGFK